MTTVTADHPLVDGAGPGWVATETRATVAALTVGMSDLLHRAAADGIRPIVVTHQGARMTRPLAEALSGVGGHWVVRADDGALYDARTGAALDAASDVLALPRLAARGELAPAFLRAAIATRLQVVVTASTRHRVTRPVRLGGVCQSIAEALTGRAPVAWGATEPLVAAWDRDELTEYSRRRMPAESRWAAVGEASAPLIATIRVARTSQGVEETTRLWTDAGGPGDARASGLQGEALTALGDAVVHGMPLLAIAFAHIGAPDLTRRPLAEPAPEPLALLIGPPGVRALGTGTRSWASDFDARTLGSPRLPSLLLPLGSVDGGGWQRLRAALSTLDTDAVGELLSLAPAVAAQLARGQRPRPNGDADA